MEGHGAGRVVLEPVILSSHRLTYTCLHLTTLALSHRLLCRVVLVPRLYCGVRLDRFVLSAEETTAVQTFLTKPNKPQDAKMVMGGMRGSSSSSSRQASSSKRGPLGEKVGDRLEVSGESILLVKEVAERIAQDRYVLTHSLSPFRTKQYLHELYSFLVSGLLFVCSRSMVDLEQSGACRRHGSVFGDYARIQQGMD